MRRTWQAGAVGRKAGGLAFLLLGLAILTAGCSKPRTALVSGKVYAPSGKPLPGGSVVFYPTEGRTKHSTAEIKEDGSYEMPNAPTGNVKIAVNNIHLKEGIPAPVGLGGGMPKMPKGAMKGGKAMPADAGQPPKTVDKEGLEGSKTAPQLSRYVPIDPKFADPEKSGLTFEVKAGTNTHDIKLPK